MTQKLVIVFITALFGVYLPSLANMMNVKRGQRFAITLQESGGPSGFRWTDPVINPIGVVRFEGPRRHLQSANQRSGGMSSSVFNLVAIKNGEALVSFRQLKGSVPGRTHTVAVRVS